MPPTTERSPFAAQSASPAARNAPRTESSSSLATSTRVDKAASDVDSFDVDSMRPADIAQMRMTMSNMQYRHKVGELKDLEATRKGHETGVSIGCGGGLLCTVAAIILGWASFGIAAAICGAVAAVALGVAYINGKMASRVSEEMKDCRKDVRDLNAEQKSAQEAFDRATARTGQADKPMQNAATRVSPPPPGELLV